MFSKKCIVWSIICFLLIAAWGISGLYKKQAREQALREQALVDWESAESAEKSATNFQSWKSAALSWEKAAHSSIDEADASVAGTRFWDAITFSKECWRMAGEFARTDNERREVAIESKRLAKISFLDCDE